MSPKERQRLFLAVFAVLLLAAVWRFLAPAGPSAETTVANAGIGDDEEGEGGFPGTRRRRTRAAAAAPTEVVELETAKLDRVPRDFTPGRDPWRYQDPPPPPPEPPPPPPSPEELARLRAEQERLAAERAAEAERLRQEALIPRPPEFTLSYLGNFGSTNKRIAVFSDGKTTYNVLEGEVLEGKFLVARIGYESVDIEFVGFPDVPAQRLGVGR